MTAVTYVVSTASGKHSVKPAQLRSFLATVDSVLRIARVSPWSAEPETYSLDDIARFRHIF